jgi:lipoyl(octanoyl) transferase
VVVTSPITDLDKLWVILLDLENFFTDIHKYLRFWKKPIILTLHEYGIVCGRSEGETGVWLGAGTPFARKICAMGVRASLEPCTDLH